MLMRHANAINKSLTNLLINIGLLICLVIVYVMDYAVK